MTFPQLWFSPAHLVFAPGSVEPRLVQVYGSADRIAEAAGTTWLTVTVASADVMYHVAPGAAACAGLPAGVAVPQCPAVNLPNISAAVVEHLRPVTKLLYAQLSDQLDAVTVYFDGPTDGGGGDKLALGALVSVDSNTSIPLCGGASNGVAPLGDGAQYLFTSSVNGSNSQLVITLGYAPAVRSTFLRLLPSLKSSVASSEYLVGRVPVWEPAHPVLPQFSISGVTTVSPCESFYLTVCVTVGGGSGALFVWTLVSASPTPDAPVLAALNAELSSATTDILLSS